MLGAISSLRCDDGYARDQRRGSQWRQVRCHIEPGARSVVTFGRRLGSIAISSYNLPSFDIAKNASLCAKIRSCNLQLSSLQVQTNPACGRCIAVCAMSGGDVINCIIDRCIPTASDAACELRALLRVSQAPNGTDPNPGLALEALFTANPKCVQSQTS